MPFFGFLLSKAMMQTFEAATTSSSMNFEWLLNPFRTAVPFWGQTNQISSSLSPKRDCGCKGVMNVQSLPAVLVRKVKDLLYVNMDTQTVLAWQGRAVCQYGYPNGPCMAGQSCIVVGFKVAFVCRAPSPARPPARPPAHSLSCPLGRSV